MKKRFDLIDYLNEEEIKEFSNSKASLFFRNKTKIIEVLKKNINLNKQVNELKKEINDFDISAYYYSVYLNKLFNKSYTEYLNRKIFEKYKFAVLIEYLNLDKNISIEDYYEDLIIKNKLQFSNKGNNVFMEKTAFINEMNDLLKKIELKKNDIIENVDITNKSTFDNKEILNKSEIGKKEECIIILNNGDKKITNIKYLSNYYFTDDNDCIIEENVFYIQSKYKDTSLNEECLFEFVKNDKFIDLSLILFNDSEKMRISIYRIINKKLLLLESVKSGVFLAKFSDFIEKAKERFLVLNIQ